MGPGLPRCFGAVFEPSAHCFCYCSCVSVRPPCWPLSFTPEPFIAVPCPQCPRRGRGSPRRLPRESLRETETQISFVGVRGAASWGETETFIDVSVGGEQNLLPAVNALIPSRGTHSLVRPALQDREPTGSGLWASEDPAELCSPGGWGCNQGRGAGRKGVHERKLSEELMPETHSLHGHERRKEMGETLGRGESPCEATGRGSRHLRFGELGPKV